jgi:hypothetical protein
MTDARSEYDQALKQIEPTAGSQYWREHSEALEKNYAEKLPELRKKAVDALTPILAQMRIDAGKNIVQTPTADMVNVLTLLRMADRLTPTEVKLYAEQMKNTPLALRMLRQIAAQHSIIVGEPDTEHQFNRINQLEGAAAYYIERYTGFDDPAFLPTTRSVDRALHEESYYKQFTGNVTQTAAEDMFFVEFTGSNDRTGFEPNASVGAPPVKLYFKKLNDLIAYIDTAIKDEPPVTQTILKESILADCPENYGTAYRHYIATGGKGEQIELNPEPGDAA